MKRRKNNAETSVNIKTKLKTRLKVGDQVMVITGGNPKRQRILKGQVGKITRFIPQRGRVVVEGLNMVTRHVRAKNSQEASGKISREGSLPIAAVMYYAAGIQKPVRLRMKTLDDGRKVRGYLSPDKKKFEQIDAK